MADIEEKIKAGASNIVADSILNFFKSLFESALGILSWAAIIFIPLMFFEGGRDIIKSLIGEETFNNGLALLGSTGKVAEYIDNAIEYFTGERPLQNSFAEAVNKMPPKEFSAYMEKNFNLDENISKVLYPHRANLAKSGLNKDTIATPEGFNKLKQILSKEDQAKLLIQLSQAPESSDPKKNAANAALVKKFAKFLSEDDLATILAGEKPSEEEKAHALKIANILHPHWVKNGGLVDNDLISLDKIATPEGVKKLLQIIPPKDLENLLQQLSKAPASSDPKKKEKNEALTNKFLASLNTILDNVKKGEDENFKAILKEKQPKMYMDIFAEDTSSPAKSKTNTNEKASIQPEAKTGEKTGANTQPNPATPPAPAAATPPASNAAKAPVPVEPAKNPALIQQALTGNPAAGPTIEAARKLTAISPGTSQKASDARSTTPTTPPATPPAAATPPTPPAAATPPTPPAAAITPAVDSGVMAQIMSNQKNQEARKTFDQAITKAPESQQQAIKTTIASLTQGKFDLTQKDELVKFFTAEKQRKAATDFIINLDVSTITNDEAKKAFSLVQKNADTLTKILAEPRSIEFMEKAEKTNMIGRGVLLYRYRDTLAVENFSLLDDLTSAFKKLDKNPTLENSGKKASLTSNNQFAQQVFAATSGEGHTKLQVIDVATLDPNTANLIHNALKNQPAASPLIA